MQVGVKTPDEIKDFSLDWYPDIGSDVVPLSAQSTWTIIPAGPLVTQSNIGISPSNSNALLGSLTTVWISGGVIGQVYQVKNSIITTSGRNLTKVMRLLVEANNVL
jgi:hypothetical protein